MLPSSDGRLSKRCGALLLALVSLAAAGAVVPVGVARDDDGDRVAPAQRTVVAADRPVSADREFPGLDDRSALRVAARVHRDSLMRSPAGVGAGRVAEYLSDHVARVTTEGGRRGVVSSALPLRVADRRGRRRGVDLSLQAAQGGFRLANPLVGTRVARRVGGGVLLGDIGVRVRPVGIGGDVVGRAVRGKVFYPNVATDTDLVAAPVATGLELYSHLRSSRSPERLRYRIDLPRGARLRSDARGGGFELVRGDRRLAWLAPPVAWDANRRPVPVSWVRRGEELVLRVEHRGAPVRYPVVADPAVIEDFRSWRGDAGMDYSGWNYESDPANKIKVTFGENFLGRGLYLFNRTTSQPYAAGDTRRWFFNVLGFGDAYIYRADFTDTYHTASNSCTTEGIFSRKAGAYEPGAYAEQCFGYGDYRAHTVCARGELPAH